MVGIAKLQVSIYWPYRLPRNPGQMCGLEKHEENIENHEKAWKRHGKHGQILWKSHRIQAMLRKKGFELLVAANDPLEEPETRQVG